MGSNTINQCFVHAVEQLISDKIEPNIASIMKKLGRSPNIYSEIKGGRMKLQLDMIQIFCAEYSISLEYIFYGIEPVFKSTGEKIEEQSNRTINEVIAKEDANNKTYQDLLMRILNERDEKIAQLNRLIGRLEAEITELKANNPNSYRSVAEDLIAYDKPKKTE